jgi:phosphoglycolate phosphatase
MSAARPTVVFDLDGTLVDSAGAIAGVINDMRVERGQSRLSLAEVTPYVTFGGAAMAEALLAGAWGDTATALATFRQRYGAAPTPSGSVYPGAREALAVLSEAGFGLAVFSNKTQPLCEKVLGDLRLASFFAAIVGTGPETPHKPDPTGYFQAVGRAGGAPEHSCLVGDSEADEAMAMRAGVPFIFAAWGYGRLSVDGVQAARAAIFVAKTFSDVPGLAGGCLACSEPA